MGFSFGGRVLSRLTRHEILKEDKFLTTLERARDFFLAKQKQLVIGLGAIALLFVLFLGSRYYFRQRDETAKDELSQALRIYHASVTSARPPSTPAGSPEPVFATSTEKFSKALAEFQKVSARHASYPAGKIARYYAGLSLRELNRTDEAIATLEPLSKEKSDFGALAQRGLATVYESTGNVAKAAEVYQQIVQNDTAVVPKSESLMHLAQLYEQQGKTAEAMKVYQQVIKDFAGTSYMGEAEQKLKQLTR
jgi:tetratricopeptide (TPR) repeat protein